MGGLVEMVVVSEFLGSGLVGSCLNEWVYGEWVKKIMEIINVLIKGSQKTR